MDDLFLEAFFPSGLYLLFNELFIKQSKIIKVKPKQACLNRSLTYLTS
jgi:hypothetical protein